LEPEDAANARAEALMKSMNSRSGDVARGNVPAVEEGPGEAPPPGFEDAFE